MIKLCFSVYVSVTSMHLCLVLPTLRNAAEKGGGVHLQQKNKVGKTSPEHRQLLFILLIIQKGVTALICLLCTQGSKFGL